MMQGEPKGPWKPDQGRGGEDAALLKDASNYQMETATVERSHALTLPSAQKSSAVNGNREMHEVGGNEINTQYSVPVTGDEGKSLKKD